VSDVSKLTYRKVNQDILTIELSELRRRVGMVFQKSNPFPKSIYENISYGLRIAGVTKRSRIDEAVEKSLRAAALWDEVKDRLEANAFGLSGGQQQRLAIARAILASAGRARGAVPRWASLAASWCARRPGASWSWSPG